MKCPHCGAEIGTNSKFCEACGSQISYSMRREQEQVNKQGCPQCGSSNIQFKREKQGEVRGKKSNRTIYRTVGFCKDCGYTWYPSSYDTNRANNNNMVLWVLGWLFFFPAPVMVLVWRKKNTWDLKVKIAVTVLFWLILIVLCMTGDTDKKSSEEVTEASTEETTEASLEDETEQHKNAITITADTTTGMSTTPTGKQNPNNIDIESDAEEDFETIYELNDGINRFINYFNKANPDEPITKEMAQPYHHHGQDHEEQIKYYIDDYEIVITGGASFYIGNNAGKPHTNDEYEDMFKKYMQGFNLGISNDQLDADWDTILDDLTHNVAFDHYEVDAYVHNDKVEYMKVTKKEKY